MARFFWILEFRGSLSPRQSIFLRSRFQFTEPACYIFVTSNFQKGDNSRKRKGCNGGHERDAEGDSSRVPVLSAMRFGVPEAMGMESEKGCCDTVRPRGYVRTLGLYWVIILVPAIPVFVAAAILLRHESERMQQRALSSLEDRARLLAREVQSSVNAVQDEVLLELTRIPVESLQDTLMAWERSRPLVRNAFIWKRPGGLVYPGNEGCLDQEAIRFAARYEALFSGRVPWSRGEEDVSGQRPRFAAFTRQAWRESQDALFPPCGWIPWFTENKLDLLAWVEITGDNGFIVYGVELEFMALWSALVVDLPMMEEEIAGFVMMDGKGTIMHHMGESLLMENREPLLHVSLSPTLPHWTVSVYAPLNWDSAGIGGWIPVLGGILLSIFLMALVFGGILLSWEVKRTANEAMQKTSFVSNVSHELKTPLTSIRMYAELLSEDRLTDLEKRKRYLEVMVAESQRLTRLVNNVLDFSRLEQGRKTYRTETLNLGEVLSMILESHRLRIKKSGVDLAIEGVDQKMMVRADRDSLEQAVLNLIDNALKYASKGGDLTVELRRNQTMAEIHFMDRGPGIPADRRDKIFEKFYRVDDSLTADRPGCGLGLSIARQLSRDMAGDLRCRDREGGGIVFVLSLPLVEEANRL